MIVCGSGAIHAQSKREIIRRYQSALEACSSGKPDWNTPMGMAGIYHCMDSLPRHVWGKVPAKQVGERQMNWSGKRYGVMCYDLDGDRMADEFSLNDESGKELRDEFAFRYDLNKDGLADYIVYNGGMMMDEEGQFLYYFYHWVDRNDDGKIDLSTNPLYRLPTDSFPDMQQVLLIRDDDFNGTVDQVVIMDLRAAKWESLKKEDEAWRFSTPFGEQVIKADDKNYFGFQSAFFWAMRENR